MEDEGWRSRGGGNGRIRRFGGFRKFEADCREACGRGFLLREFRDPLLHGCVTHVECAKFVLRRLRYHILADEREQLGCTRPAAIVFAAVIRFEQGFEACAEGVECCGPAACEGSEII